MVAILIKLPCTKGSAPDQSVQTIGILGRPVLYFCGDFISGSSGSASGGKGLNEYFFVKNINRYDVILQYSEILIRHTEISLLNTAQYVQRHVQDTTALIFSHTRRTYILYLLSMQSSQIGIE
jgi:hypothetical protein